jgi:DNA polymerase-1
MSTWDDLPLSAAHVKALVESGLTPEVAAERGYRTLDAAAAPTLGTLRPTPFGRRSWHAGLLVPSHGVTGEIVGHQLRPDAEVIHPRSGDIMKYLTPYREPAVIDCPPRMLEHLRDPDVPLLITEGAKKADAAAARGLLCLALRGVDNWTSGQGTALEEWRDVRLLGRRVGIAYDSDLAVNRNVRGAARRLAKYLVRRGAQVSYVLIPGYDDGRKRGLDDWLVDHPGADPWTLAAGTLPDLLDEIDPDLTAVPATDLDVADVWVERNAARFRYLTQNETWLGYNGARWDAESGTALARAGFQDMVRTLGAYSERVKNGEVVRKDETPWLRSRDRIHAVLGQAAANREMHASVRDLDDMPYLFNLGNCTYDLRRDVALPHDPSDLLSLGSAVDYDPDATAPQFEAFLRLVLPEEDTRAFVQRVFGMALIGDARVKEHVFPVFQGTGRNGKGTLMRLVQAVFGSYYSGISKSLLIVKQHEDHPTVLASLFHKRLVTAQEVGKKDTWNAEQIKELVGGDDLTGRYMRENEFTFTPSHTLVMAANNWPKVSAEDEAFWARVRKVPFTTVFTHPDPNAETGLRRELPGVLNWLIAGCRDYQTDGLGEPAQVAAATAASRAESDPLGRFLAEYVDVTRDPADTIVLAELYDRAYVPWHRNTRETSLLIARRAFGAEIAKTAGIELPRKVGKGNITTFHGLRLGDGGTQSDGGTGPFDGGPIDEHKFALGSPRFADDAIPRESVSRSEEGEPGGEPRRTDGEPKANLEVRPPKAISPAETNLANLANLDFDISSTQEKTLVTPERWSTTPPPKPPIFSSHLKKGAIRSLGSPGSPPPDGADPLAVTDRETWAEQGAEQPSLFAGGIEYERLAPGDYAGTATEVVPDGVVVFDIESESTARLYETGPEFVRLLGYQTGGDLRATDDPGEMLRVIRSAGTLVGHNIMNFDMIPFALHHGVDIHQMAADGRLYDTQLTEVLINPPSAGAKPAQVPSLYKLETLGQAKFGVGKVGDLADLVKKHGGDPKTDFGIIPTDDAEYVRYCAADVDLTARLALTQRRRPGQGDYIRREHQIAAIAAQISMNGFRVDRDLLDERYRQGQARKDELRQRLIEQYAMPTTRKDGTPAKGLTEAGRAAIERAFNDLGVSLPLAPSGKGPATGKETMEALAEAHQDRPDVLELIETVQHYNGVRTVYGSALEALHADGRVHPVINMYQLTGRWSVTHPGLTVFGKRGGRYVEREIFVPDDGEAIIAVDLAQVDARAVAAWAQDPEYLAMFGPGMDLHAEVAYQMFGDRARRDDAKALGHGYNYGLGYNKLANDHGPELARIFLDTMDTRFPRLVAWKDEIRREAEDNGLFLDNGWGRLLQITAGRVYTQAPAAVGQSAARDIMMEGLLRLPRWVLPMLRVQVHDEIVLSVPEDRVGEITAVVKDALSFPWRPFNGARGHDISVNIEADASPPGRSWGAVYAK